MFYVLCYGIETVCYNLIDFSFKHNRWNGAEIGSVGIVADELVLGFITFHNHLIQPSW